MDELNQFMWGLGTIVVLFLIGFFWFCWYISPWGSKEKKEQEEAKRKRELDDQADALNQRQFNIHSTFGVKLNEVHESTAQDEMVRTVNLLAFLVSEACVNQEKESYHVVVAPPPYSTSWGDYEVRVRKEEWAQARNFAIQVVPELAPRMPHFSEFEPLKSYRKQHLEQKRRKASK